MAYTADEGTAGSYLVPEGPFADDDNFGARGPDASDVGYHTNFEINPAMYQRPHQIMSTTVTTVGSVINNNANICG